MPEPVNQGASLPVDGWLARLAGLACPARCLVCGEAADRQRDLCAACARGLPWNRNACATCAWPFPDGGAEVHVLTDDTAPRLCADCRARPPPLQAAHAAFVYGFPLDRLLPRLKFHQDLAAGRLLSAAMAGAFARLQRPEVLVPVPLHRERLRSRGYDQALELARPLALRLGVPLCDDLLRRARHTRPQSRLDAVARRGNLHGAFAVCASMRRPLPAHVVLVDDVMTTGATLHAAARALRSAGVARVDAWICARVP